MNSAIASPAVQSSASLTRRKNIWLVFGCTVVGAAAQVLIKNGANSLSQGSLWEMVTNLALLAGYSLYGISTLLLVLALKEGELSILYPVISLTYVWVTLLSVVFFREVLTPLKLLGVAVIVIGVGVLGRNGRT